MIRARWRKKRSEVHIYPHLVHVGAVQSKLEQVPVIPELLVELVQVPLVKELTAVLYEVEQRDEYPMDPQDLLLDVRAYHHTVGLVLRVN